MCRRRGWCVRCQARGSTACALTSAMTLPRATARHAAQHSTAHATQHSTPEAHVGDEVSQHLGQRLCQLWREELRARVELPHAACQVLWKRGPQQCGMRDDRAEAERHEARRGQAQQLAKQRLAQQARVVVRQRQAVRQHLHHVQPEGQSSSRGGSRRMRMQKDKR